MANHSRPPVPTKPNAHRGRHPNHLPRKYHISVVYSKNPYNKYQIEQAWNEASKRFEAKMEAEAKEDDDKIIALLMSYLPEYNKLREKFYSTPFGQLKQKNIHRDI